MKNECEQCGKPFKPAKVFQRFCCTPCQQAWNYQQRKHAAKRAEVEAAEAAIEDRMNGYNGHGTAAPAIDLAQLGLVAPPQRMTRRA